MAHNDLEALIESMKKEEPITRAEFIRSWNEVAIRDDLYGPDQLVAILNGNTGWALSTITELSTRYHKDLFRCGKELPSD